MRGNKLPMAEIRSTEEGGLDGFSMQWIRFDSRNFGTMLLDWINSITPAEADKRMALFLKDIGLNEPTLSQKDLLGCYIPLTYDMGYAAIRR